MGYRIVRITNELLVDLLTQGNAIPRDGYRIRVAKGLPADASIEAASSALYYATNETAFRVRSAEWGDVPAGHATPEFRIEFTEERIDPAALFVNQGLMPEGLAGLHTKLQEAANRSTGCERVMVLPDGYTGGIVDQPPFAPPWAVRGAPDAATPTELCPNYIGAVVSSIGAFEVWTACHSSPEEAAAALGSIRELFATGGVEPGKLIVLGNCRLVPIAPKSEPGPVRRSQEIAALATADPAQWAQYTAELPPGGIFRTAGGEPDAPHVVTEVK